MKPRWNVAFLSFVVCFASFAAGQGAAAKPGQEQFVRGRQLIQANCVDCMGGSRAGIEQGVREIGDALKAGYVNKKAAYKLLLNAYADLATYTEKDPAANQAYATRRFEVLKKLVDLSPQDSKVLKEYADNLQSPDEKAPVLAKIVELNPSLIDARYELGLITAEKGNTSEGIAMVEEAINRQGDPDSLRTYVQELINLLDQVKCRLPDAEQWNTKLNEVYDEATQGAGDPAALSDFKKSFLQVVGKQPCVIK